LNSIDLKECFKGLDKPWNPREIANVNNHVVRVALFDGEYHWHKHSEYDELFYVLHGRVVIEIRNRSSILLEAGELVVVPQGVEHRPTAQDPAQVLLFEPKDLAHTGD
jgi:mannose-6-phosphate isomerase-like protein (cupin superfamily)